MLAKLSLETFSRHTTRLLGVWFPIYAPDKPEKKVTSISITPILFQLFSRCDAQVPGLAPPPHAGTSHGCHSGAASRFARQRGHSLQIVRPWATDVAAGCADSWQRTPRPPWASPQGSHIAKSSGVGHNSRVWSSPKTALTPPFSTPPCCC